MQGQLTVSGLAVRDANGKLKRVARLAFNSGIMHVHKRL